MRNIIEIQVRSFPVLAHNHRTGREEKLTVPVTKEQLRAAQLVGQSSTELVERLCDRQGYTVIEIGQPAKVAVTVDLDKLVEQQEERDKWNYLYGISGEEDA